MGSRERGTERRDLVRIGRIGRTEIGEADISPAIPSPIQTVTVGSVISTDL